MSHEWIVKGDKRQAVLAIQAIEILNLGRAKITTSVVDDQIGFWEGRMRRQAFFRGAQILVDNLFLIHVLNLKANDKHNCWHETQDVDRNWRGVTIEHP